MAYLPTKDLGAIKSLSGRAVMFVPAKTFFVRNLEISPHLQLHYVHYELIPTYSVAQDVPKSPNVPPRRPRRARAAPVARSPRQRVWWHQATCATMQGVQTPPMAAVNSPATPVNGAPPTRAPTRKRDRATAPSAPVSFQWCSNRAMSARYYGRPYDHTSA